MPSPEPEILTIKDWENLVHVCYEMVHLRQNISRALLIDHTGRQRRLTYYLRPHRAGPVRPAGAPEGVHHVHCNEIEYVGASYGAIVKNSRFGLRLVADAALSAVCQAIHTTHGNLDHVYIEAWRYGQETRRLYVTLGS